MAKERIPITTIDSDFLDGDILYGADINKIIDVFRAGSNANKLDINRLLSGSEYYYIADDLSGLQALALQSTPDDGQYGFVFDGEEQDGFVELYSYNGSSWDFVSNTSLINPFVDTMRFPVAKFEQDDITTPGTLFYDSVRHTLVVLTDLGEYKEIGSNLGDFAKNKETNQVWEGQPVTLTGIQGESPIKEFGFADASVPELSTIVGVVATSTLSGYSLQNSINQISVFGDVNIPDFTKIIDSNFLTDLELEDVSDIPFGTKLYLSTEAGKYSAKVPTRPNAAIWVATVEDVKNNGTGKIFVYPTRLRNETDSVRIHYETLPEDAQVNDLFIDYD